MVRYVFFPFPRVKDHCFSFAQCRQLRLHHTERRICYFKRVKTKTIRWYNNNSTNKVNQNKKKYNTKEQTSYCNFCLPAGMPRDSLSLAFSTEICNKLKDTCCCSKTSCCVHQTIFSNHDTIRSHSFIFFFCICTGNWSKGCNLAFV